MRRLAWIVAVCAWASLSRAAPPAGEAEVKAAIVFNVLQFVQWPAGSLVPGAPLVVCAPEGGGLASALARFDGMRVRDAGFLFRQIPRTLEHLAECNAIFVESGDPYLLLRVVAASRTQAILVIAEGSHALPQGVDVGLALAGNRVVFDINLAALRAAGFAVSSKLLRLARSVIE